MAFVNSANAQNLTGFLKPDRFIFRYLQCFFFATHFEPEKKIGTLNTRILTDLRGFLFIFSNSF